MSDAIFTYGTLMVPEIWQAVTQLSAPSISRSGLLHGYQRRRVEGADFPGIRASKNKSDVVNGCVYENISPEVFERLDQYEDEFYQRIEVVVEIDDHTATKLPCQTYIVPASCKYILSDEPWDLDTFKVTALDRYLKALGIR